VRALWRSCRLTLFLSAFLLRGEESLALYEPRSNVELVSWDISKVSKDRWCHYMRLGMLGEHHINKSCFSRLFWERKPIFYKSYCYDLQDFSLYPFGLRNAYFGSGDNYCGIDGYFLLRENRMPKLARNSSVLSDLGHKQSLQSSIVLAGRTLQHSTYMRPNEYGGSAPSILQCAGYRDDGGTIAPVLKISCNSEFSRNPRALSGDQKITINFVGIFCSDSVDVSCNSGGLDGFDCIFSFLGGIGSYVDVALEMAGLREADDNQNPRGNGQSEREDRQDASKPSHSDVGYLYLTHKLFDPFIYLAIWGLVAIFSYVAQLSSKPIIRGVGWVGIVSFPIGYCACILLWMAGFIL
jgi:hypothetical protein